jgi:hypothetical protein
VRLQAQIAKEVGAFAEENAGDAFEFFIQSFKTL